jgi:hypothetical protein
MEAIPIIGCGAGALALIGAIVAYWVSQRRLRERLYSGRPALTGQEYYAKYFSASGIEQEVVTSLIEILNRETRLDFTRLDPDHTFGSDFGDWLDDGEWWDVDSGLQETMNISLNDLPQILSTRELIEEVAQAIIRA